MDWSHTVRRFSSKNNVTEQGAGKESSIEIQRMILDWLMDKRVVYIPESREESSEN